MEIVKNIMTVVSGIILIGTFLSAVVKPIRQRIIGWIRKKTCADQNERQIQCLTAQFTELKDSLALSAAANCATLRHHITNIYFRYLDSETLPAYEKENLIGLYEAYCALKGNHYVEEIYKDMMDWDVVKKARG